MFPLTLKAIKRWILTIPRTRCSDLKQVLINCDLAVWRVFRFQAEMPDMARKPRTLLLIMAFTASIAVKAQQQPGPGYPVTPPEPLTRSMAADSYIEGTALSDAGELAYVIHSADTGNDRTALLTSKRSVARDGDVIDGKTLTRIWAAALAINARGLVAFEADFKDANGTARGVFINNRFVTAIKSEGTPTDFTLTADGRVVVKAGIAIAAPVHAPVPAALPPKAANQQPTANCGFDGKPTQVPTALRSIWQRARVSAAKATGIDIGTVDDAAREAKQANCAQAPAPK